MRGLEADRGVGGKGTVAARDDRAPVSQPTEPSTSGVPALGVLARRCHAAVRAGMRSAPHQPRHDLAARSEHVLDAGDQIREGTAVLARPAQKGRLASYLDTSAVNRQVDQVRGIAATVTVGVLAGAVLIASAMELAFQQHGPHYLVKTAQAAVVAAPAVAVIRVAHLQAADSCAVPAPRRRGRHRPRPGTGRAATASASTAAVASVTSSRGRRTAAASARSRRPGRPGVRASRRR